MLITHVLVTTPATSPEIRTLRGDALGRRFHYPDEFSFGEGFLLPNDASRNPFSFDRKRDEDRFALRSPNAFTAKGDVIDDQRQFALHSSKLADL